MKKLFVAATFAVLIASPALAQQSFWQPGTSTQQRSMYAQEQNYASAYGPFGAGQWQVAPEQGVSDQERTLSAQQDTGMYAQDLNYAYAPAYGSFGVRRY